MSPSLTKLQDSMNIADFNRGIPDVKALMRWGGQIDFQKELCEALNQSPMDEEFLVLDIGCGTGRAIEEWVLRLRSIYATREAINGVGIDVNPCPEHIPESSLMEDGTLRSKLIKGDAHSLGQLEDESVNVGYSIAVVEYLHDALKALEEGYRVLKEGGKFYWVINGPRSVAVCPYLYDILDQTPGANEVFKLRHNRDHDLHRVLICEKKSDSGFEGFPFKKLFSRPSFSFNAVDRAVRRTYYRRAA
jgi:ubiquinone/menaquinone biosynthesis C-methylase UbiE